MEREWYAVKGLFRWYFKSDGSTDSVEERVLLFLASSFDEALAMAESEAQVYCADDPKANFSIESMGWWDAYRVEEEPNSGVEVYSRLSKTNLSVDAFIRRYYPRSHDEHAV
ncbi:DUF4288 domain-containing protein [Hydrogenophaga flava]|uniref:DUF4288 domain-containing protein n=1 Tax=Hydrogenophaga flava TaxID=65657 RepID=UPI000824C2F2|nr:DUF4288 domain-containing protein [Hydrogenophaga flava]